MMKIGLLESEASWFRECGSRVPAPVCVPENTVTPAALETRRSAIWLTACVCDDVDGVHLRDRVTDFDATLLAGRGGHDRVELHGDRLELEVQRGGRAGGDGDGLALAGEADADNPHGHLARRRPR